MAEKAGCMKKTEMLITEAVLGHKPVPEKKGRGRYFVRCLLWFLVLVISGLVAMATYLYFHQDEIKHLVVNEINRNLKAPVSVRDIRVGMWRDFPMISLSFEGVSGNGSRDEDRETLFYAESLTFSFNLRDILQQRYIVREIVIRGGEFNLKYYGEGVYNYQIWRTSQDKESRPVSFHLRRILLRNTLVRFRDLPAEHDFQLLARNLVARGDLYENGQDFQLKGGVDIHSMKAAGFVFLHQRKASLDVRFSNDFNQKRFSIQYGRVGIESMDFTAKGHVDYGKHILAFDFKGDRLRMEHLLAFLPAVSARYVEDYGFKGNLDFRLHLEGDYTRTPLALNASFRYGEGKIRHKPSSITVSDVTIHGSFTNGGKPTAESCRLVLDTLYAKFPTGTVDGSFSMANFRIPHIRYEGSVSADLAELQTFLKLFPDCVLGGHLRSRLAFSHTFPSMRPRDWQAGDLGMAQTRGFLQLKDFKLAFAGQKALVCDSLYADFSSKVLKTGAFVLKRGDMALQTRLFVENLLPYLLLSRQRLYASATIKSPLIDWDSLCAIWPAKDKTEKPAGTESEESERDLLRDLYVDVDLAVKRFVFPQSGVENLKTELHVMPEHITLENISFDALQGHFEGGAEMERRREGWQISLRGKIDRMDVGAGFKAFDNFGQNQLTYKNIGGTLSSDFRLGLFYAASGRFLTDSLRLSAALSLSGGRLQNMESLKKIARFTGEDDLQDIHFTDLHNIVEIREGCIRIPEMQVFSSAADLSFSGIHTFANEVDYKVTVELSSLLSRRRAQRIKKEEEFGVVTGPNSRIRLPLRIRGVLPEVEVKYDFSQARQGAGERLRENARELKESMQEEYSQMRKKREARMEAQKTRKRQEEGAFIIDTEEAELLKKPMAPAGKDSVAPKKKKYKTEDDFRIEFEDE